MSTFITMLLAAVQAAAPTPTPAPTPATGAQAMFDRANRLYEQRQCGEAVPLYTAVEQQAAIRKSALARAAIALRKGVCIGVLGDHDQAAALIETAMPVLEAKGEGFASDRRDGHIALGKRLWLRFDYDGAERQFDRALALSKGVERYQPLAYLAQITSFDGGEKPLAYAAEAAALAEQIPSVDAGSRMLQRAQHARILLNQNRLAEGYGELRALLSKSGGLGLRVGIDDIVIRSDLALAALLRKDEADARRYLAYTGQGRIPKGLRFERGAQMAPPSCGGPAGLSPDEKAVIEFGIADDGSVTGVNPIYVTGGRKAAVAFAEAVSHWSWEPRAVQAIPEIFRATIRVQMACSNAVDRPDPATPLRETSQEWLTGQGMPALIASLPDGRILAAAWGYDEDGDAAPADRKRFAAALRTLTTAAEGKGPALLTGALVMSAQSGALPLAERLAAARRAVQVAQPGTVAPSLRAHAALTVMSLGAREKQAAPDVAPLRAALVQPDIAGDPLAAATLRLIIVVLSNRRGLLALPPDADALLAAVIAEPALPASHPLKVSALLQRASLLAERGDLAGAAAAYAATGLTDEQCATLGVVPALRSANNADAKFPLEAMRWGFEGWVRLEADIAADGRAIGVRPVIAYPPFVFENGATAVMRGARYRASFRPEGAGAACTARSETVNFRIP